MHKVEGGAVVSLSTAKCNSTERVRGQTECVTVTTQRETDVGVERRRVRGERRTKMDDLPLQQLQQLKQRDCPTHDNAAAKSGTTKMATFALG